MKRIFITLAAVAALGLGIPQGASAYCDPNYDGGCTNSCKETGKVVQRVLKNAEWNCPQ